MTDEQAQSGTQPSRFDDDRLLACALELDDDPELLAAAEADAALGARLAAMRADVAAVGARVAAAVPQPEEDYTDLSDERWSGLAEFFESPPPGRARQGRRWWRVVAPVAAVAVLALVAGVAMLDRGGSGTSGSTMEAARSSADGAAPLSSAGVDAAKTLAAETLAEQLDHFAVVVLARAREATGALQRFAVVRIFKGDAPTVVELEVDDAPADQGRLHLLMLDPTTTVEPAPASPGPWFESPEPSPSAGASDGAVAAYGEPLNVTYLYHGEPAMVREFATGTDPYTVRLPLP